MTFSFRSKFNVIATLKQTRTSLSKNAKLYKKLLFVRVFASVQVLQYKFTASLIYSKTTISGHLSNTATATYTKIYLKLYSWLVVRYFRETNNKKFFTLNISHICMCLCEVNLNNSKCINWGFFCLGYLNKRIFILPLSLKYGIVNQR